MSVDKELARFSALRQTKLAILARLLAALRARGEAFRFSYDEEHSPAIVREGDGVGFVWIGVDRIGDTFRFRLMGPPRSVGINFESFERINIDAVADVIAGRGCVCLDAIGPFGIELRSRKAPPVDAHLRALRDDVAAALAEVGEDDAGKPLRAEMDRIERDLSTVHLRALRDDVAAAAQNAGEEVEADVLRAELARIDGELSAQSAADPHPTPLM